MTTMIISCIEFEENDHDLQLHCDDVLVACVKVEINEHGDFNANCILQKQAVNAPILNGMHVTSIVLHTVMSVWSSEHETLADVFSNGHLTVNPALYSA